MLYYEKVANCERTYNKQTALTWYENGFVVEVWKMVDNKRIFIEVWE